MKTQRMASTCADRKHAANRKHKKLRLLLAASIEGRGWMSLYCDKAVEDALTIHRCPDNKNATQETGHT